ncbi:MAG TPA: DUF2922 domain-containing protein [Sedimentibacter sp.]|nr:DUF2922 domain-containing protein [Sedimentibacter sp.]HNZ83306.1 DUF2922 domain-containing protein [Sedimentibacter sp.]HOH69752.1 DUF2922 domain-containing protein [Sedimentibacter sp.]HPW99249.1 DUF2922 domain-containing protein [Sedimentibacter sp.]HQB63994.1 DUF2922 domain-containing protein [Sedimentibacter sp.]
MAKKLVMSFLTALGGTSSMTIDAPRDDLTAAEVSTVMESIITKNIFNTTKGDLAEIKSAEIITTTEEVLI